MEVWKSSQVDNNLIELKEIEWDGLNFSGSK
jgi:hypothetical protein